MKVFKQVILFDLDRTIFDTDKFVKVFDKFLKQKVNPEIDLLKFSKKVKNNFNFEEYLDNFNLKFDDDLYKDFLDFNQDNFWFNDAKIVIENLIKKQKHVGILTYGTNDMQKIKIKLLNIDLNYIITQNQCKPCLIKSWKKNDNYRIKFDNKKEVFAKKIILIDDKISNLINVPKDCLGICFDEIGEKDFPIKIDDLKQIFDYI